MQHVDSETVDKFSLSFNSHEHLLLSLFLPSPPSDEWEMPQAQFYARTHKNVRAGRKKKRFLLAVVSSYIDGPNISVPTLVSDVESVERLG